MIFRGCGFFRRQKGYKPGLQRLIDLLRLCQRLVQRMDVRISDDPADLVVGLRDFDQLQYVLGREIGLERLQGGNCQCVE